MYESECEYENLLSRVKAEGALLLPKFVTDRELFFILSTNLGKFEKNKFVADSF